MARIIYNENILKYMTLFESLTGAKVKDCMVDERIIFIVEKGNMGLALGKGGSSLRRVENTLKKTVKVVEFNENVEGFIRNYIYPLRRVEIKKEDNKVIIKGEDTKTKGLLIGRDRANLNKLIDATKRFFKIDNIEVV